MLTIVFAVLAAVTNAVSSVLQRVANRREAGSTDTGITALLHLLRQPVWLLGVSAIIVSFLLQAAALSIGQVSEVQPLMALELPFTLMLASRVFAQSMRRRDWAAILAMAGGMSLFLFALQPAGGNPAQVEALEWILGTGITGVVVVLLALAGRILKAGRGAAMFGIASGVCFALTAVFMSAALAGGLSVALFGRWQTYLVPIAGISAMLLLQLGLQTGTLVSVQPGVTLADPVIAVVLGATLFGEQLRTGGWIALEVAGAAAVAWGTFILSRSDVASAGGDAGTDPSLGTRNDHQPDDAAGS